MAWDQRGSKRYYYKSARKDGRIHRQYVGRGLHAEQAARQVEQRRQAREAEREHHADEIARVAVADSLLADFKGLVDTVVKVALCDVAYRHHGQWRRRRRKEDNDG